MVSLDGLCCEILRNLLAGFRLSERKSESFQFLLEKKPSGCPSPQMTIRREKVKMSEKFCLRWNDFQCTVSQSFQVLRKEKDLLDVTLVSDDEVQIAAHKLVLSASSSFFKKILRRNPHSQPLLYLSGINSASLGLVLDYIYQGEVQIYQEDLNSFLEVAQKLKIEGLQSHNTNNPENLKEETSKLETNSDSNYYITIDDQEQADNKFSVMKRRSSYSNPAATSLATVNGMATSVEDKIQELIERSEGMNYCKVCDYKSDRLFNTKEHVEIHIEGLSYSCQLCDKTFRSRHALRTHSSRNHK